MAAAGCFSVGGGGDASCSSVAGGAEDPKRGISVAVHPREGPATTKGSKAGFFLPLPAGSFSAFRFLRVFGMVASVRACVCVRVCAFLGKGERGKGVVWCGVVRCGGVWCGGVWCGSDGLVVRNELQTPA